MPKISVIVPTMRVGGLDVLCAGLAQQSYTDFELVLVDGLFAHRGDIFTTHPQPFPVTHVAPHGDNPFPVAAFCRYANTGLLHARGEIAVMFVDYTWAPANVLDLHWRVQQAVTDIALVMPHDYRRLPALNPHFVSYGGGGLDGHPPGHERVNEVAETDQYVNDLKSGRLDACMWSIFAEPFTTETDPRTFRIDGRWGDSDPKLHLPGERLIPVRGELFHAKNASMHLKWLLDVNGWDEDLDGSHGWQDTDIAERLTLAGVKWLAAKEPAVIIPNPRTAFPFARRLRDYRTNETIWQAKQMAGYPPPNDYDLRKTRETLL